MLEGSETWAATQEIKKKKKVLKLLGREGYLVTVPHMMLFVSQTNRDQAGKCSFVSLVNLLNNLIPFPQRPQLLMELRA